MSYLTFKFKEELHVHSTREDALKCLAAEERTLAALQGFKVGGERLKEQQDFVQAFRNALNNAPPSQKEILTKLRTVVDEAIEYIGNGNTRERMHIARANIYAAFYLAEAEKLPNNFVDGTL
jgi:hypothetical protein